MVTKRTKKTPALTARVLQDHFSEAINIVSRAVPKRSSLPIIGSLLLESDHGRLQVIATDLQTRVTAWVGAQIETGGGVAVPAPALKKLVGLMPDEALSLAATIGKIDTAKKTSEPSTLEIKSDLRIVTLDGHDPQDFPPTPAFGDDRFTIDPDDLAQALDRTLFAVRSDDARPVLSGVHLLTTGHHLRFEACDGFRLSVATVPIRNRPGTTAKACKLDVVVPADTLTHLRRILPRKASETRHDVAVALLANESANKKEVRFSLPNYDVDGAIIAGVFPETENILPSPPDLTTFDVAAFTSEVAAAAEVVKDSNNLIEIHTDPATNTLRVFAKAAGTGRFEGTIDATGGHKARIARSAQYVLDALRALHTARGPLLGPPGPLLATIGIESEGKPAMFRPELGGGFYHIIMPMFVSESDWQAA